MYSYEERKKAVDLYIKYGKKASAVINELGYPNRHVLVIWYKAYIENGKIEVPDWHGRSPYSEEQKQTAVKYYLEHGRNLKFTIRQLGYPSYHLLSKWVDEVAPSEKRLYNTNPEPNHTTTTDIKIQSIVELCTRSNISAETIAKKYDIDRSTLYFWKNKFMNDRNFKLPDNCNTGNLEKDNEQLKIENERLKQENFQLQLMNDILTEAAKVLKKDQGINLESLTNREKMVVIDTLRTKYLLKTLLKAFCMAKSSYCYHARRRGLDKYKDVRKSIVKIFYENKSRYGSRRIHSEYCKNGNVLSERIIRKLMKEENLHVINVKMKKYSSYKGEISPAVENLVKRNFHADKPNKLWLTDISEFHIPAGKVYLSPIIDCYDGWIVKWRIGLSPNTKLTNTMLKDAIKTLKAGEYPICHTDGAFITEQKNG